MADVVIVRASVPVLTKNQGIWLETAAVPDGDDLVLDEIEQSPHRTILCTPGAAIASLNLITDGAYAGQRLTLMVADAQTLRVPSALGNVDATANLDALKDTPLTLMWNGAAWQAHAR